MLHTSFARALRRHRLHRHGDQRLLIVPLDHAVSDGPIAGGVPTDHLVGEFADNGADAVVLHKGALRHVDPVRFRQTSLVLHLSASTVHAPDPDAKQLVATVDEAVRLGADAVSMHVNVGSEDEPSQLRDLGAVADACDRWNMPLLAMMYLRGPRVVHADDPALVAHAAVLAAELGADIAKIPSIEDARALADVTRSSAIPLVIAGGPRRDDEDDLVAHVDRLVEAGVAGVAMGRNLFEAPDPGALTRRVASRVHRGTDRDSGLVTLGTAS